MPQSQSVEAGTGSGSAKFRRPTAAVPQTTEPPFIIPLEPQSKQPLAVPEARTGAEVPSPPSVEGWRMFFHISSISLTGFLCQAIESVTVRAQLLMLFLMISGVIEYMRTQRPGWRLSAWFNAKARTKEEKTRSASTDFLIGLAISFAFFREDVLAAAVYATAWCDPIARLVGVKIGRHRWPYTKKTVEGSLACAATAAIVAKLCFPHLSWLAMVAVGASALIVELLPQWTWRTRLGDIPTPADNCYLTIACAGALSLFVPGMPQV